MAHSLGCRVVLEAVKYLDTWTAEKRWRHTQVASTCLMAAAVPVALCQEGQDYGTRPRGRDEVVLWSNWDFVLTTAFPPGELAGLEGLHLRSVGSSGQPERRWKTPRRPSTGLGHSDYYGDKRAAQEVAAQLLRWRDKRQPPIQEPAERPVIRVEHREPERELASRGLGDPLPTWLRT